MQLSASLWDDGAELLGGQAVLRYRITQTREGRHVVVAAPSSFVPISETYATRDEAQDTADWLNRGPERPSRQERREAVSVG